MINYRVFFHFCDFLNYFIFLRLFIVINIITKWIINKNYIQYNLNHQFLKG